MYICEREFDVPGKDSPKHSFREVDFYASIPRNDKMSSHRLSLRKNLYNETFEVYRKFYTNNIIMDELNVWTLDKKPFEVISFVGDFWEALEFANAEYAKYYPGDNDPDKPCRHKYPELSIFCKGGD